MIVYVKTNFVLELARLQEQHESCEELLNLASTNKIKLVLPAFSITEARTALVRLAKQRVEFQTKQLVTLQPSEAIFGGGRCGSVLCARYCSIAWTTV